MSRAALVTGASRGLGRAAVRELARRGYSHLGIGASALSDATRETLAEVEGLGARGLVLAGDLADPAVPARLVGEFLGFTGGRLDLLVNNAGFFRAGVVPRIEEAEWDRQVEINLSAPFRMMRAAGEALAASRGAVVNVSSVCGFGGAQGSGPYSAAKAGLEALTRAAAVEWGGAGVRVNALIPGFLYYTDMGRASTPDYVEQVLSFSPLGLAADVESAARMIAEMAEAPAATGQVFSLEGRAGRADAPKFCQP